MESTDLKAASVEPTLDEILESANWAMNDSYEEKTAVYTPEVPIEGIFEKKQAIEDSIEDIINQRAISLGKIKSKIEESNIVDLRPSDVTRVTPTSTTQTYTSPASATPLYGRGVAQSAIQLQGKQKVAAEVERIMKLVVRTAELETKSGKKKGKHKRRKPNGLAEAFDRLLPVGSKSRFAAALAGLAVMEGVMISLMLMQADFKTEIFRDKSDQKEVQNV